MDKSNIFISESSIGTHGDMEWFDATLYSFTFFPKVMLNFMPVIEMTYTPYMKSLSGFWIDGENIKNSLSEEELELSVAKFIALKEPKNIFIGFDDDKQGDFMAEVLKYRLVDAGFDEESIFRIPLTADGYVAIREFMPEKEINSIIEELWKERKWMQIQKENSIYPQFGRNKTLSIKKLLSMPESVKNINPEGTSTITYILQQKLSQK